MDNFKYELARLVESKDCKTVIHYYVEIQIDRSLILVNLMKRYHVMINTLLREIV